MKKHLFVTLLLACGAPIVGTMPLAAQQKQTVASIVGTVIDENDEPVIGASVVPIGASNVGTSTDIDGKFSLRVKAGTKIRVSYIGYRTVDLVAANGMSVKLERSDEMLDEVVVVGYGTQKKVNLTGAVSTVDVAKSLEGRPQQDVAKALQGAVPGLTITVASGEIGDNAKMSIRGLGTLSSGTQGGKPLIVVDGIEMDDISYLNTQDIESISVLKDAASSSIYGTRAAFGVILIQTKGASKVDRVSVKYSNNFAWDGATYLPEFPSVPEQLKAGIAGIKRATGGRAESFGMNFDELLPYAELWEQQHNGPAGYREMKEYVDDSNVGDYRVVNGAAFYYANWDVADIWFNNAAPSQSHNLAINGTSGNTNYYLNFGYDSKEGLMNFNPDKLNKYTASMNITSQIKPWLQVGGRFNFSRRIYSTPNTYWTNHLNTVWRWGSWFGPWGTIDGEDFRLIADRKCARTRKNTADYLRMTAYIKADITKDLTLNGDFTYWTRSVNEGGGDGYVYGINSWARATTPSYIISKANSYTDRSNQKYNTWNFNVYANYNHTWNDVHNFGVMLGANAQSERYDYFYVSRSTLLDTNLPELNLATGDPQVSSAAYEKAYAGYFGRLNYNYKDTYLLEVNGRYDGSSSFPSGKKWAFFPSFSAGYRMSQEAYWEKLQDVVNNAKLRVSYGEIGNEDISNYSYYPTISAVSKGYTYWVDGVDGNKINQFYMPSLVSSNLTWERIRTTDVGLDLGFLQNSINVTFDWFQRTNANMLAPATTLPDVVGASSPVENAGSLRTRGWELAIGWNHRFGDVSVYANASIADAFTVITEWNNDSRVLNTNYSGKHYGDIWGFETDRYFTEADFDGQNADGSWNYKKGVADQTGLQLGTFVYGPGDIKYKDLDGSGVIDGGKGTADDHGDLKVIGNTLPRYEYSFRLGAAWKGFDIDLFFQGVGKRDAWAITPFNFPLLRSADLTLYKNQTDYVVYEPSEGKTAIDQSARYPRLYAGNEGGGTVSGIENGRNNYYPQSKYLIDMSYLRVKNITLGYTLPQNLSKKAYIENARVYFSCTNPFLIYKGHDLPIDPEVNSGQGYASTYGNKTSNQSLYWGRAMPVTHTISFGLQVTF